MGLDYYNVLYITRSATDMEIKKAYRKLALKYHPQRNTEDNTAEEKFQLIAEAYDILCDPRKRAVYDQFGEEGLKTGIPEGNLEAEEAGAWSEGYTFHGDAQRVFREFFGSDNPFQEYYDRVDGDMHMSFGGLHGRGQKKQDPPIERDLTLTLEELYHGCIKKMKISRRVMNDDGHTSSIRDKILSITVKPGWKENTKITFQREGDQGPNCTPADIIFIVKDKEHERFKRAKNGADLIHVAPIPLGRALTEHVVDIKTLDDRVLHIPVTDIVYPGYVKTVPNEGMPVPESVNSDKQKRGDLHIYFDIIFPRKLSPHQKRLIEEALCDQP